VEECEEGDLREEGPEEEVEENERAEEDGWNEAGSEKGVEVWVCEEEDDALVPWLETV
jgi:hypothetical protein